VLDQSVRERVLKGDIQTTPVNVLPGKTYPNPFDSSEDDVPLEEHRYRLGTDGFESRLSFDFRVERLPEDIGGIRRNVSNNAEGI